MLQHRQVLTAGDFCTVSDEHILFSDALDHDTQTSDDVKNINAVEAVSGCLTTPITVPSWNWKSSQNMRFVASRQHTISYDYIAGQYNVMQRTDNRLISKLSKRPPPHAYIACSCASQLSDGMFFFSYATSAGTDDPRDNHWQVHAIMAGDNSAMSHTVLTEYKGSGFAEKPLGRIVSLHCHPSKQYLFVVYSKGTVQVWSYTKVYQELIKHSQQGSGASQQGAQGGFGGDAAATGSDPSNAGEDEDEGGQEDGSDAGTVMGAGTTGGTGSGRSAGSSVSTSKSGLFGQTVKHVQARLLKAVASFALPTNAQLTRLDPEYEHLVLAPSSFRLDSHGRFAAVVWSERIMCVYDIYTLLMLSLLQKPQNRGATPSAAQAVNVVQLSIFGAFPCRSVPSASGVEYNLGPMCFHPIAQVVFLTVLRNRRVPRMQLTSRAVNDTLSLPLPPLVYAVSLSVHQPILSSIGSYEIGGDLDLKSLNGGSSATSSSINWRPQSIDCTTHSGLLVVTFTTCSITSALRSPIGVDDIDCEIPSAAFATGLVAEDSYYLSLANGDSATDGSHCTVARDRACRTSSVALVYGLSPAWQLAVGALSTRPICSPLPVPPDVYLYGEGVMCSRAAYVQRTQEGSTGAGSTVRSFALVESGTAAAAGSGDVSDSYPLLLTLRAAFDGSDDGLSANAIVVNYHMFRTHWAFPQVSSAAESSVNSGNGGGVAGKNADASTSTAAHIGSFPAVFTSGDLARTIEAAGSWAELPAEHHLSLVGWDDDLEAQAQALSAQLVHTFYPQRLVTKESIGLSSMTNHWSTHAPTSGTTSGMAVAGCWDALLVGTVRRSVASNLTYNVAESTDINITSASRSKASVCLLRFDPHSNAHAGAASMSVLNTSYRDAAYFLRRKDSKSTGVSPASAVGLLEAMPSPQTAASAGKTDVSVLALSHSGRSVHELNLHGLAVGKIAVKHTSELGGEMCSLWTAPAGAPNVVLFASAPTATACQTLYATAADPTAKEYLSVGDPAPQPGTVGTSNTTAISRDRSNHSLQLAPGETLLEAEWQPLPSTAAQQPAGLTGDALALLLETQQIWLRSRGEPLLALRTTHRVLMCTNKLEVLNAHIYCKPSSLKVTSGLEAASIAGTDGILSSFLQDLLSAQQATVARSTAAKEYKGPTAKISDTVTGVAWMGAALCYTCESGAVHYLLSAPCVRDGGLINVPAPPAAVPIFRALGHRMQRSGAAGTSQCRGARQCRNETDRGLLCTLPRNISTTLTGSHRILAVLSDRALVSYLRRDDAYHSVTSLHQVAFSQRPLNPLEPLVLGLIALDNLRARQASTLNSSLLSGPPLLVHSAQHRQDAVDVLMCNYVSPRAESTTTAGGARPSAQCSRRLSLAISQYQAQCKTTAIAGAGTLQVSGALTKRSGATALPGAIALAVGLHSQLVRAATCGEFPAVRWVPSSVKYHAAAQVGLLKVAAMELLSSRAELQELLLDSDGYAGNAVPHVHRPQAAQLVAGALNFLVLSQRSCDKEVCDLLVGLARRLMDIGGDYSTLSAFLLRDHAAVGTVARIAEEQVLPADRTAFLRFLAHVVDTKTPSTHTAVRDLLRAVLQERLYLGALGCTTRKKNLTVEATAALSEADSLVTTALTVAEGTQKEHFVRTGNSQGPPLVLSTAISSNAVLAAVSTVAVLGPKSMGLLALDLLEDFMAVNLQLEMCSTTTADLAGGDGAVAETAAISSDGLYMGSALPESWVEGVGAGSKEHEFIMAYYRFSDIAYQTEDGFHCSSIDPAGSRLVFTDLSRFEGPGLELYTTANNSMRVEYSSSSVDPGEKHDNVKSLCDVVYCCAQAEGGESESNDDGSASRVQRGLRCPVPRGSQLDIGLYHEDVNRSKLTMELMVCFDEMVSQAGAELDADSGASVMHVLLQRQATLAGGEGPVLWTLFVTPDGTVCFAFGDGKTSKASSMVRSAPDSVALPKSKGRGSATGAETSPWTHIAVVIDSSKASCSVVDGAVTQAAVAVSLVVKGELVDAKLSPVSLPLSHLTKSTVHVGRNLPTGYRLTELRLWSDTRSMTDLDNMRDNYLVLAMKRKRLQLRVKGTKKLFTAFRDIEVPAIACLTIRAPAAQDKSSTEDEDKPAVSSVLPGGVAKVLPKALSTPLSLTKAPKPTAAVENLNDSTSAATSTYAQPADLASSTASGSAAAVVPVMSARERRLSQLKGGATAVIAANAIGSSGAAVITGGLPLPGKASAISKPGKPTLLPEHVECAQQTATPEPSPSNLKAAATAEIANHPRVSFADAPEIRKAAAPSTATPVLSAANIADKPAANSATKVTAGTGQHPLHSVVDCCSVLGNLSTLVDADVRGAVHCNGYETYSTARPFALPNCWMLCFMPKASAATSVPRGVHSMQVTSPTAGSGNVMAASLPEDVRKATESAILTITGFSDSKGYRLAVLANKSLSVFRTAVDAAAGSAELTAQLSLAAVKLVYWTFISADMILMVSSNAGFTLKVAPSVPPAGAPAPSNTEVFKPKPVKIFDRIDLAEPLKWNDRVVLDLQVCADGWTLLSTCNRVKASDTESAEAVEAVDRRQSILSLHHAKSGKSLSFAAVAGCFRVAPGVSPQVLLVWKDENRITSEPQWCVTAIDLADVHQYWAATTATAPAAAAPPVVTWKDPLVLGVQCPLPVQWSLQLQNSDTYTDDKGSARDSVAAACLDAVSDPSLPSVRVVTRSGGDIWCVSLKAFSKLLSAPHHSHKGEDCSTTTTVSDVKGDSCACLLYPAPQLYVWSIGKLVYVLTKKGELHQCSVSSAVPQYQFHTHHPKLSVGIPGIASTEQSNDDNNPTPRESYLKEMLQDEEAEVRFKASVQKDNGDDTFDLVFADGATELGMKRSLIHFITDVDVELRLSVTIGKENGDGTYDVVYACGKVEQNVSGDLIHKRL